MIFALIIGCAVDANGVTQEGPGKCMGFAGPAFETQEQCEAAATTKGVQFVIRQGLMPVTYVCVPVGNPV